MPSIFVVRKERKNILNQYGKFAIILKKKRVRGGREGLNLNYN